MFINKLYIKGFRCFSEPFEIELNDGLNVIVGENGSGKTAIISAIRQLFIDSESGRYIVTENDFYKAFESNASAANSFSVKAIFDDLNGNEKVAFLQWCDLSGKAVLNLDVENREIRGRFKKTLWGGSSRTSAFETEVIDYIQCIYLPPLRDAESKLINGRQSRLSKLLRSLNRQKLKECRELGKPHPLEDKISEFNESLAIDNNFGIKKANDLITDNLKEAIGEHFGQSTVIQFTEPDFTRIVEGLRLLFFPDLSNKDRDIYRSLQENSLGYNNLLYIASILAELSIDDGDTYFRLLLIEEPEAHLHPQLQIRLLKHIQKVAKKSSVQVIVTTHSTVLASSLNLDSIIHLSSIDVPIATPLSQCGLTDNSKNFVNRWLDVTKSNILFASGVILVEGIAEQMLIPELAKIVLNNENQGSQNLEDLGVSVINLNGIYFKHFMPLYCNFLGIKDEPDQKGKNIPIRCSGITDLDPPKTKEIDNNDKKTKIAIKPFDGEIPDGKNPALKYVETINKSDAAKLFVSKYKTLEYDLAMEADNAGKLAGIIHDLWPDNKGTIRPTLKKISEQDWLNASSEEKSVAAHEILKRIDDDNVGKGFFAQVLAEKLANNELTLSIPIYIRDAIRWSCNIGFVCDVDNG